jgi:hypothetical protein
MIGLEKCFMKLYVSCRTDEEGGSNITDQTSMLCSREHLPRDMLTIEACTHMYLLKERLYKKSRQKRQYV